METSKIEEHIIVEHVLGRKKIIVEGAFEANFITFWNLI